MEESQVKKEILQDELNLNFLIQFVRIENEKTYETYDKLYIKVGVQEGEVEIEKKINYEVLEPAEIKVKNILHNIMKLYDIYKTSNNDDLIKGIREEILKLLALLMWNIYH